MKPFKKYVSTMIFLCLFMFIYSIINNKQVQNEEQNQKPIFVETDDKAVAIDHSKQPTLIIVASINSGTSTLNQIVMYHFRHFFHSWRDIVDVHYWIACVPKQYMRNIQTIQNRRNSTSFLSILNFLKNNKQTHFELWDASLNNLIYRGCKNPNSTFSCNKKCTHKDYMDHIGYGRSINDQTFPDKFFNHLDEIKDQNNYHRYPNETNIPSEIFYFYDRTSAYNSLPYIPAVISTNYQYSKLLYIVREPITQMYSHFRLFDQKTKAQKSAQDQAFLSIDEANQRFTGLLELVKSDIFLPLIPLLKQKQTDEIKNEIVIWYIALWAKKGIGWKDDRIFDVCPYVNILLYVKSGEYFNKQYGMNNFKLIQFEWETQNLLLTSIYIYCWTVFDEYSFNNGCVDKYTKNNYENLNEIMFSWEELVNHGYGRLTQYKWSFSDLNVFDELIDFFKLCDQGLIGLMEEYPSLVLGEFNIDLWNDRRKQIREQMSEMH